MSALGPRTRGQTAAAAALSAAVFGWAHAAAFAHQLVANDDTRQQIFWMHRWRDPRLFGDDLLADYARQYVPWGVQALYRGAALLVEPLLFSKILTGLLFVLLASTLFRLGAALRGVRLGWAAVSVLWLTPFFLGALSGGLSRGFVAPLVALFLLGELTGSAGTVAVALLAESLLTPYAFLLCAAAWVVRRAGAGGRLAPLPLLAAAAGAVALLGWRASFTASGYGPLPGPAELDLPEFGLEGRYSYLPPFSPLHELVYAPWSRFAPFREGGLLAGCLTLAALTVLAVRCRRGLNRVLRGRPSLVMGSLATASLLLYTAARLSGLRLFFPSRYLETTAQLLACLATALVLEQASRRALRQRAPAAALVFLCAVLGAGRLRGVGLSDYRGDSPLVERVRRTPASARFAGHPYRLDNVLAFGGRRVVASYELAHPWSRGYWALLEPRLDGLFEAYYAADPAVVDRFSADQSVDYWVVDERDFRPEFLNEATGVVSVCEALRLPAGLEAACRRLPLDLKVKDLGRRRSGCPGKAPFFEPFDARIRASTTDRARFALLDPSAFPGEWISPHVRLVDLRRRRAMVARGWSGAG